MGSRQQRWVSYDRENQPSVEEFLRQWKPSVDYASHIDWICISKLKADYNDDSAGKIGLIAAWEALCLERHGRVYGDDLQRLAIKFNVISGKWLVFVAAHDVDRLWHVVASAVMAGRLGLDAKVSTCSYGREGNSEFAEHIVKCDVVKDHKKVKDKRAASAHVICVYCPDFNDIQEVFAMREKLIKLGFGSKLKFKPDAYSFCGVYFDNRWRIPPVIYSG